MKRLIFVDNLKVFLICLVITHHIAIAYGGAGDLLFKEGASDPISPIILTLFTGINQSFFMTLFFMLSAYFTVGSLDKKGNIKYLKDRLIRLGIPLIVYVLLISPINRIIAAYAKGETYSYKLAWHTGPLWFLEALLIFSIIYMLVRNKSAKDTNIDFPRNLTICKAIFILSILTFIVRIFFPVGVWIHVFQLADFVHYIFMFYVGTLAYKHHWFEKISDEMARPWKITAIIAIISYPLFWVILIEVLGYTLKDFTGGFAWLPLVMSFLETVAMVSIIISLLAIFKKRFNRQGTIVKWMSVNYYGAYIFHATLIYLAILALYGRPIPSILKFLMVALTVVPASFYWTSLIRKLPGVKRVLG